MGPDYDELGVRHFLDALIRANDESGQVDWVADAVGNSGWVMAGGNDVAAVWRRAYSTVQELSLALLDRELLITQILSIIVDARNFPESAMLHLLGVNMVPLAEKIADRIVDTASDTIRGDLLAAAWDACADHVATACDKPRCDHNPHRIG